MANWKIELNNLSLGGFAPAYHKETYPSYGNKNHAGSMLNMDLTNPGFITQGPGLANLTNGSQAAAVPTLIKHILDQAVTSDVTYGIGGAKLYKLSSTTVTSDGTWPHTIDKGAVTSEDGESVCHYGSNLYYFYNHSGPAGDIGKYDLASTFDDDWGSTVPTGMAALTSNPHPSISAGNDVMYFGNGRYVGSYDGTTLITQALDLPVGSVIVSLKWMLDRLWITANRPNISGSNKNTSSIFIWDGTTDSWDSEIILMGISGGSHVRNGILFQFYRELSSTGGYKLAYVDGASVVDLANFTGSIPAFYQITDFKDFIIWDANGLIHAYGSGDKNLPIRMFQLADSGYSTVGAVSAPFGTPMVSSWDAGSNFRLAQFSGYDTACNWKSLMFDVNGYGKLSRVDAVRINFETLATNARVDWKLLNSLGTTVFSDNISFAKLGAANTIWMPMNGRITDNFRVEFDFTNGNTTNPVKIKNVTVLGSTD